MRLRIALLVLVAATAQARVTRLEVLNRADIAHGYERIEARVHFRVDPKNAHNRAITDIDLASSHEFAADLVMLRPKHGGNDTLFLEVPNRGGLGRFSDPARDNFPFVRGYTLAWLGWQFDVRDEPGRLRFDAPVAKGVKGKVRSDFIVEDVTPEHTIGHWISGTIGGKGYPVADRKDAVLTERDDVVAPRRVIPKKKWRFTSDTTIALDGGFVPGRIYEITYTAADPAIVGMGLAAVRDFVSYLKYDEKKVKHAYGFGISQSGRFLRHMLYEGFNADEEGRQVFDGMLVHVAGAGRGGFNQRFAQPSRDAQPLVPAFYPVDVYPFTDDGLLAKAQGEKVVPKIFYMNTGYEYWSRGGSLIHTTPDGTRDVEPAPTSRIYALVGHGHIGGPFPPEKPKNAQSLQNPLNYWPLTHALLDAMDAWVKKNMEPPPSRYPRIADGTLVRATTPFAYQPFQPDQVSTYTALVPAVDANGNELGGVRMPFLTAPIATFRSWNLRDPKAGFPQYRASFVGAIVPFAKEKLPPKDTWLGRFAADTVKLVEERYVVKEDVHLLLTWGSGLYDWVARASFADHHGREQ
jgi:Alpha/beta hydrolase domain